MIINWCHGVFGVIASYTPYIVVLAKYALMSIDIIVVVVVVVVVVVL